MTTFLKVVDYPTPKANFSLNTLGTNPYKQGRAQFLHRHE